MKAQPKKNLVKLLLPLGYSSLLLIILLCGLSQATEAGPRAWSAAASREGRYLAILDYQPGVSVCEQTRNLVPDPGFDRGIGWETHWYPNGECSFYDDQPGHDSYPSALIDAPARDHDCTLTTFREEIPVEGDVAYDYSAWIKTGPMHGEAYLRVIFWKWQEDPPRWTWAGPPAYTNSVTDTRNVWVHVTGSVQSPADAEYATVEAVLPKSSDGSAWFDDIFLGLAICLDVSKHDHPDPVSPGQILTYTIVYSNAGQERATDVWIIETYDRQYVRFLEDATVPPPDISDNIWVVPTLSSGISGTISAVVQVEDDAERGISLVNCVELHSDETVKLVYTCISTVVDGDVCAIAIYPREAEQTVGPGDPVNYDLTLYNVGTCDGQANLVAHSSQGWDVIITPEPPYTMPSDSLKDVRIGPVVTRHASSITDVTRITAALVCGPPCSETVTATATATVTTIVTGAVGGHIYLPLVLRDWPPIPVLYPIDNADIDGDYDVSWSTIGLANSYVLEEALEEATDSACIDWQEVYTGPNTRYPVRDKSAGRYCYRVKACNGWGCGGSSNVERVGAWWEHEPNNLCPQQTNGPIVSGPTYSGTFTSTSDARDYFDFDLSTPHPVELWLTNIPNGCDYDVALRDSDCARVCYSDNSGTADEHCLTNVLPAGQYYIQVYPYRGRCLQPYHLRAVYQ